MKTLLLPVHYFKYIMEGKVEPPPSEFINKACIERIDVVQVTTPAATSNVYKNTLAEDRLVARALPKTVSFEFSGPLKHRQCKGMCPFYSLLA